MGTQLPLPAGWASMRPGLRDPHTRLAELIDDSADAKAKIRELLDGLAEKYGVAKRDVDLGMMSVDDTLSDLLYNVRSDIEGDIVDEMPDDF